MKFKEYFHIPESKYKAGQIARWLWAAWRGNRLQAVLNATIGILGVVLSLLTVWAMQRAMDIAQGVREGSLYWAVGIMAAIILCEFAVGISRVWIKNILGVRAQNRMQQQMLGRLLRSEWRGREAMHSGDVINRLEQDVQHVVSFLTETLPSVISTLAMFIGAFVYLMQMDTWLACVTVGILPVFLILSRYYIAQMRRLSRSVRKTDSRIQSILTETMQHRMLVKTMEADDQMLDRLDSTQAELRSRVKERTAFSVASHLVLNTGFSVGYLVAFLWGALRLSKGTLTFGGMTAFLQLVYRIQGPARDLTRLAPAFVSVFTAAERLMELEEIPEEEQGEPQMLPAPCGIRFSHVSFNYGADGQDATLRDANYDFRPGTCTAILGETGSGKTTLIRLLLALVKPQKGEIRIYTPTPNPSAREGNLDRLATKNSKDKANQTPLPWGGAGGGSDGPLRGEPDGPLGGGLLSPLHRCNFVYVPQGNTLLSGTLRDNLLLGNPAATDEQMMEALHTACADFVADLPQGLDTVFAEQGGGLSEGQAQRLSIARALLRPGSIMLLDEATSALDAETERTLLHNLLSNQQRTVIFVTHREAVVGYCDQVIDLGRKS